VNKSRRRLVERFKPRSYQEVYLDLLSRKRQGKQTTQTDELWKLFGYSSDTDPATIRRRKTDFNIWLKRHGYSLESTTHVRLYLVEDVQERKKPRGLFDPSA
jgi:hypothetical protein